MNWKKCAEKGIDHSNHKYLIFVMKNFIMNAYERFQVAIFYQVTL